MPDWLTYPILTWHGLLAGLLAVQALRARTTVVATMALVALSPVVIGVLAWLAAIRMQPGYLDIALAIAMLGIAEALTILRTVESRERTGK